MSEIKDTDTKTPNQNFIYEMELILKKVKTKQSNVYYHEQKFEAETYKGEKMISGKYTIYENMPKEVNT